MLGALGVWDDVVVPELEMDRVDDMQGTPIHCCHSATYELQGQVVVGTEVVGVLLCEAVHGIPTHSCKSGM